uniref:Uncharacterized protein n=1 Tax=Oryza barthii TaxID=65489 RepID=A0A0D3ENN3_9ORYZ
MPASGLPTGLRTLSMPLWRLVRPTALSPSRMAGTSGSVTPRICQFWRVVTSAQPSLPYASITLARYLVCSLVVTPFGSFSRIMNRPSAQRRAVERLSAFWAKFTVGPQNTSTCLEKTTSPRLQLGQYLFVDSFLASEQRRLRAATLSAAKQKKCACIHFVWADAGVESIDFLMVYQLGKLLAFLAFLPRGLLANSQMLQREQNSVYLSIWRAQH